MVDPQSNINCKNKLKILIKKLSYGTTLWVIPPGMSVLFAINWLMTSLGPQLPFIKKKKIHSRWPGTYSCTFDFLLHLKGFWAALIEYFNRCCCLHLDHTDIQIVRVEKGRFLCKVYLVNGLASVQNRMKIQQKERNVVRIRGFVFWCFCYFTLS